MSCFNLRAARASFRCRDDDLHFLSSVAQAMSAPTPAWHAWLLVVPLTSVIYDLLVDSALQRWMSEPIPHEVAPREPVTFFRPLKRGVPRLREKLETLLQASSDGDQVLFGVDPDSEEEAICHEVCRAFPGRDIAVVRCEPGRSVNPKISKLVQMAPLARHGSWLLSDSEIILPPGFLEALRDEWQAKKVAALTTAYRFVNCASWPQRCDALGVLLGLWPGISLVRRYGRVNFTLGACTLFQREALMAIGGWQQFGSELAEDQRLGEALSRCGQRIRLSRQVATLDCDTLSWRDYWRHQRRVAVTYRAANPAGFAGVLLTFGPVWSVLGLVAVSAQPWMVLAAVFAIVFRAWRVLRATKALAFPVSMLAATLSVASGVEALCWLLSWFSRRVWWSGRWWCVGFRGELTAVE
jgi:ceramide glucosyltransferase